jgi:DNA mismatch repair protein MutL
MNKIKLLNADITNTIDSNKTITKIAIVVKELMENSIDAGSKNINILIKDGGISLIEIRDDGSGIAEKDFEKLCSRFNSSKFGDKMDMLTTLGFRGEALAILSYISGLTITSRSRLETGTCGYEAVFKDGKMIPMSFKASTCDYGTTVRIANLFSNNVVRKGYYEKSSDETKEIIMLLQKYAFHFHGIGFTLASNSLSDVILRTKAAHSENSDLIGIYRHLSARLFSQEVSDNLFYFNNYSTDNNVLNGITYDCVFTKPSANLDRSNIIIFVNNRLIQNQAIKRLVDQTYSKFLIKNGHYFVYLNIKCKPDSIDVNVKGNKSEVYIEDEHLLLTQLKMLLEENLNEEIASKNYYVGNYSDLKRKEVNVFKPREDLIEYIYAKDKVRVDTKNISIERYLDKTPSKVDQGVVNFDECLSCIFNELYNTDNINEKVTGIFRNCYYIGYESDNQLAFIQHDTSLYIINIRTLLQEYFLNLILQNKQKETIKVKSVYSYDDLFVFFRSNIDPSFAEGKAREVLMEKSHLLKLLNVSMNQDFHIAEILFIDLGIDQSYRKHFLNNLPLFIYSLIELMNTEGGVNMTTNSNLNFLIEVCKIYTFYLANVYLQYLRSSDATANKFLKNLFTELKVSKFFIRKNIKEDYLIEKIVDTETLYTVFERC